MPSNIFDLVDTWTGAGTTFYGIKLNVTYVSAAPDSRIFELETDGASQFSVDPHEGAAIGNPVGGFKGHGTLNASAIYLDGSPLIHDAAPLDSPLFVGNPRAPTPATADNSISIATTAFVKSQDYMTNAATSAAFQAKDDDLTSLAGTTEVNVMYYRSAPGSWTPVSVGDGLAFSGGVLQVTTAGVVDAQYITAVAHPELTAERVLTDSATIVWDFSVAGQAKANSIAASGNINSSGSPISGQYAKWTDNTHIAGVSPATVLSDIGAAPLASPTFTGDPKSTATLAPTDSDTSLATTAFVQAAITAAAGGGSIPPVNAEYITSTASAGLTAERVLTDSSSVSWDFSVAGQAKANVLTSAPTAHGFTANSSVTQTIPGSTWTKLNYGTAAYNNGSFYNTGTSRFTPPAGEVNLVASAWANGVVPGNDLYLAIYKNGVILRFATSNNVNGMAQVTCFDLANGTDFYETWIFGYSVAANFTVDTGNDDSTYFQGSQPMGPQGPQGIPGVAPPSPFRTGDVKLTFQATPETGWIIADDGSIGDGTSGGTTRANADTVDLFTLFYNAVPTLVLQDNTGATVTRGANAATDFGVHRRLVIPKMLGRAIAMAGAGAGLTNRPIGTADGAEKHTMTAGEMFKHSHPVNDPTHTHGYSDGGHLHGISPGASQITGIVMDVSAVGGGAGYSATPGATITQASGIGISIIGNATGISTQQVGNTDPFDIMNPRSYMNAMIKL